MKNTLKNLMNLTDHVFNKEIFIEAKIILHELPKDFIIKFLDGRIGKKTKKLDNNLNTI